MTHHLVSTHGALHWRCCLPVMRIAPVRRDVDEAHDVEVEVQRFVHFTGEAGDVDLDGRRAAGRRKSGNF